MRFVYVSAIILFISCSEVIKPKNEVLKNEGLLPDYHVIDNKLKLFVYEQVGSHSPLYVKSCDNNTVTDSIRISLGFEGGFNPELYKLKKARNSWHLINNPLLNSCEFKSLINCQTSDSLWNKRVINLSKLYIDMIFNEDVDVKVLETFDQFPHLSSDFIIHLGGTEYDHIFLIKSSCEYSNGAFSSINHLIRYIGEELPESALGSVTR